MEDYSRVELPLAIKVPGTQEWTKDVVIGEMTGFEEDILADMRKAEDGSGGFLVSGPSRVTKILSRITERIGDVSRPGGKDRFDLPDFFHDAWKTAYSNDRAHTLIRARMHSQGAQDVARVTCPSCKREISRFVTDLSTLETRRIPLDVAQRPNHSCTLPVSGDVLSWRFLQGESDEEKIGQIMQFFKAEFISAVLFLRLLKVNGASPQGGVEYVRRMRARDRRYFSSYVDAKEGGTETSVRATCPSCDTEFTHKLEVMRPDFFFPSDSDLTSSPTASSSPKSLDGALAKLLGSPVVGGEDSSAG